LGCPQVAHDAQDQARPDNQHWVLNLSARHDAPLADAVAEDLVARGFGHKVVTEGLATIPNGQSSVSVSHELSQIPAAILVTGAHLEVASCIVSSADSAQFTIQAPANVSADRGVYWELVPAN